MSIRINKTFTVALTAVTFVATLAMASTDAQAKGGGKGWHGHGHGHWHGRGIGIGLGVLGASTYVPYYVCERVPMFDQFGNYIGSRRVCSDD